MALLCMPMYTAKASNNCKVVIPCKVLRSSEIFEGDLRCVCQTIHGFAIPLSINRSMLVMGCSQVVTRILLLKFGRFWLIGGSDHTPGPEKQLHRCNGFSKKNVDPFLQLIDSTPTELLLPRWEEEQRLQVRFRIVVLEQDPRHCLL